MHWSGNWHKKSQAARSVLEQLYTDGTLVIHHKNGSRKYYDLAEKHLDSELLRAAWNEYKANQREIDEFDVCRALAWLYVAIPDVDFRQAMQIQLDFFAQKLGGSH
jgi:uncharacterized protein YcaQ